MSERKTFVAVCTVSSDYDTHYGVVTVRYGDYQRLRDIAALVAIADQHIKDVIQLTVYDAYCLWFERIPWAGGPDSDQDESTTARRDEVERSVDGGWVQVPEDDIDTDHDGWSSVRTSVDHCHVDPHGMDFSFYEKHGEHHYISPSLSLRRLREHFEEV